MRGPLRKIVRITFVQGRYSRRGNGSNLKLPGVP